MHEYVREDEPLSPVSRGRRDRRYGLFLWIRGAMAIAERFLRRDDAPVGQVGGLISPLLEVLRTGEAARWVKGQWVLDCGCGRAKILQMLPPTIHYTGLDHDSHMVDYLRWRYPNGRFLCMDVECKDLPAEEKFDCLLMVAILEHVADAEASLQRWVRHVRPGGRVIVTTPVPLGQKLLKMGSRLKIFDREAADEHTRLYDRVALEQLFAACVLEPIIYRRFALGGNQLIVGRKL